jgi:hypothetical protein
METMSAFLFLDSGSLSSPASRNKSNEVFFVSPLTLLD